MKLRKINSQRYCDGETGTYFDLSEEMSPEQAREQIEAYRRNFLNNGGIEEDYYGAIHLVFRTGKKPPPPPKP